MKTTTELLLTERIADYLNWPAGTISSGLFSLKCHHGQESLAALDRFITWAEKHGKVEMIAPTIAHDLNGAGSDSFCPRSSGF